MKGRSTSTQAIGENFPVANKHNERKVMSMRKLLLILVAIVATAILVPSTALATNGHQDHRGACARSTTSLSKGLGDLQYNGVLGEFAGAFGVHGYDGSLKKQLGNRLTIGVIARSVSTNNHGCTGSGGTFPVGKRTLYKGEHVVVKTPAKYGKSVCVHSHRGCRSIVITVKVVLPTSCWNLNTWASIKVRIWIKVSKAPAPKPKPKPTPQPTPTPAPVVTCESQGMVTGANGNCVVQTNQAEQDCEAKGGTWSNGQCTVIQVNGNCSNITVTNGSNNVVSSNQQGNCNTTVVNQSPPPPTPPTPPAPPVDHAPVISCVYPAHVYQGGSVYIWCEATDSDNDALSVNVVSGNSNGHTSGTIPSNVRWDGSACPAGVSCYRTTFWGDAVGTAQVTAMVSANGKSATSVGSFPVVQDQF